MKSALKTLPSVSVMSRYDHDDAISGGISARLDLTGVDKERWKPINVAPVTWGRP